jgi:DNA-directed RNA polymerase specialized sigma24 family protein
MPNQFVPDPIYSGTYPAVRRRKLVRYSPLSEAETTLIPQLSPDHQQVLLETGAMNEIAVRLNMPVGTLKSRLNRARRALFLLCEAEANRVR